MKTNYVLINMIKLLSAKGPDKNPLPSNALQEEADMLKLGPWQLSKSGPELYLGGNTLTLSAELYAEYFVAVPFDCRPFGGSSHGVALVLFLGPADIEDASNFRFAGWVPEERAEEAVGWAAQLNAQLHQSRLAAAPKAS